VASGRIPRRRADEADGGSGPPPRLDPDHAEAWSCWRLRLEKRATLTEVTDTLSIDEVEAACAALDMIASIPRPKTKHRRR
jgi:hypothetical protein